MMTDTEHSPSGGIEHKTHYLEMADNLLVQTPSQPGPVHKTDSGSFFLTSGRLHGPSADHLQGYYRHLIQSQVMIRILYSSFKIHL